MDIKLLHTEPPSDTPPDCASFRQALTDLDVPHIFDAVLEGASLFEEDEPPRFPDHPDTAALSFMERYFTSNGAEISSRLSFLTALQSAATADDLAQGLSLIKALSSEHQKALQAPSPLYKALYLMRALSLYQRTVRFFDDLLNGSSEKKLRAGDVPLSAPQSGRFQDLQAFFASLRALPSFRQEEEALKNAAHQLPLPRFIHLGFNLREDGNPQEMGILYTEGHIDLLEEEEAPAPLGSLLSMEQVHLAMESLGPEFHYNRALHGSHFDEYLSQYFEKTWKSEISKALRFLQRVSFPELSELLALYAPLSFYRVGLCFAERFKRDGYALCVPRVLEPGEEEDVFLRIEDALYPDFILEHTGIVGNDLLLTKGSSVLITGANHSGKTSYLKTIGQCFLLSQLGFLVPASSMSFHPLRHIYTLFSAGEDRSMTASRMGLEVKKLSDILSTASSDDLLLLNEPMTSTNPVEAVSICADMMLHFLDHGITHLLVTHLYDIYYLLRAKLPSAYKEKLISLVTKSLYREDTGLMQHSYRLIAHEPLGNSYARETAAAYGITLGSMLSSKEHLTLAESYMASQSFASIYEEKKEEA